MRTPFTIDEADSYGFTPAGLRWAVKQGKCVRGARGTYLLGGDPPSPLEKALCLAKASGGVLSHHIAAVIHGFDSAGVAVPYFTIDSHTRTKHGGAWHAVLPDCEIEVVDGIRRTTPLRTLLDLANHVDESVWEQMLETALRKRLVTLTEVESASHKAVRGVTNIRRVLELRPHGAPPTESLLETLMVQLIRKHTQLPPPKRQVVVNDESGRFVARVDLAYPDDGAFFELDGQQHKFQPAYDANRQTAVVATTGWLPGRFTWTEVTRAPSFTARRVEQLLAVSQKRVKL